MPCHAPCLAGPPVLLLQASQPVHHLLCLPRCPCPQRGKLEMEGAFQARIPPEQRHGSTLVFRCGSPLDPAALSVVSCATAESIIISGEG